MINQECFEFLRDDNSCRKQLIKAEKEMSDTEVKYKKYRVSKEPELIFEDNEYYVARNWSFKSAERFTKKISNKFPSISYKLHVD